MGIFSFLFPGSAGPWLLFDEVENRAAGRKEGWRRRRKGGAGILITDYQGIIWI